MSTQNWAILSGAQLAHAQTLDDDENYVIGTRAVTNENPGVGLNINPDATDFEAGAVVALSGMYVAPKRMVDDPDCATYAPDLRAFMLTLPWAMLESETIFAPEV